MPFDLQESAGLSAPRPSAVSTPVLTSLCGGNVCYVLLPIQSMQSILSPDWTKPCGRRSCGKNTGKSDIDFSLRNSQFNKKQHAKARRMQKALDRGKQSALRLQGPERAQLLGGWRGIREAFTEEVEFELSLEGWRGKCVQSTDPGDPSLLFANIYRQMPDGASSALASRCYMQPLLSQVGPLAPNFLSAPGV